MTTTEQSPVLKVNLSRRPTGKGQIVNGDRPNSVPQPGDRVEIISWTGTSLGEGIVIVNPWVTRPQNPITALRVLETMFRIQSVEQTTRSYRGESWKQPMYTQDIEYRLSNPTDTYSITWEQAYEMLPEWARINLLPTKPVQK